MLGPNAERYPETVTAYLCAEPEPERDAALIERVTGIDAEVAYLFHGPLGLQTQDITWKPEYRQALKTSIETLTLLKKVEGTVRPAHAPRHVDHFGCLGHAVPAQAR